MLDRELEILSPIRYPSLPKTLSDRSQHFDERLLQIPLSQHKSIPKEVITYILMKQKFDKLYKNIEKITLKEEHTPIKKERETHSESPEPRSKGIHLVDRRTDPQICKIRTSQLYPKLSLPEQMLQINTVNETEQSMRGKSSTAVTPKPPYQIMRKSNYKKRLQEGLGKAKMSNNIKDYLSVERISIKEMEESLLSQKAKMLKQNRLSNLLVYNQVKSDGLDQSQYRSVEIKSEPQQEEAKPKSIILRRSSKFKPPFELYYYRDLIWQVGYSNGMVIQTLDEYESKLKMYVGPGNNSNLVKGIMRRRPWWTLTSDFKEASFCWTQLKIQACFGMQKKGDRLPSIAAEPDLISLPKASQSSRLALLNPFEQKRWQQYWKLNLDRQRKMKESFKGRNFIFKMSETPMLKLRSQMKVHNHFMNNFIIGNKKALFKTMSEYYSRLSQNVFDYLPLTFHVKNGLEDDEYLKFLQQFYISSKAAKNDPDCISKFNAWIVKPGQNTNRGNGIIVCLQLNEIKAILKRQEKHQDGTLKTYIIQKYIERPLLYKKRKFDLRHYMMLNCSNGRMKGYWYKLGYVRTTSSQYTLKISNGSVHLTNDAVQKNLPDYGRFEKGNKIYYQELDQYIKKQDPAFDFYKLIYPKMKKIATDIIHASALNIDPDRRVNNFEVFGLDFMIDEKYDVWLIEVNTNPCLQTTCPVLNKIIPKFVENTFQICIDPVFPPPLGFAPRYEPYYENVHEENCYQLVFDQRIDGVQSIGESVVAVGVEEDEDVFDDDGQDFNQTF